LKPFPIILFVYNRPEHTRLTIDSLRRNRLAPDSDLHIFSDGPKNHDHVAAVREVRDYLRTIDGFNTVRIVERERNMGLAASIISGTSQVLDDHAACIVLEDDLLSAPSFLEFMNAALRVYRDRQDIFSVAGYNYPLPLPQDYSDDAYLSYRGCSWGWGTWADRWHRVDWTVSDYPQFTDNTLEQALFARGGDDLPGMLKLQMEGKIDSWSIRFDYAHHKNKALCLYPVRSKIQNIGFDGTGVHCGVSEDFVVELDSGHQGLILRPDLQLDSAIINVFNERFRAPRGFELLCRAAKKARRLARGLLIGK
jgi:hypothetical protein